MKYTNLRAFEKHLEGAAPQHFANVYMILTKEAFTRKHVIDLLTKALLNAEKNPEICLHQFDGEEHSIENILHELHALTFFSKKRMVLFQNVDKLNKEATSKLENYFTAPNDSVYFVLTASAINRTMSFYKKTEKVGVILDIAEEKPWEKEKMLAEWLCGEAIKSGKKIDAQTCHMLLKQLGTDQTLVQQELQKLICYVGDRNEILPRDVADVCISVSVENAWQLGEAIFRKDAASALRIGRALLSEGLVLIALLRQLRAQFQTEYQICSILSNGGSGNEISQQFPYMKGQILERHMQLAKNYGMQNFKKGILKIDEAELHAKNSVADLSLLADMLFVRLTT